MLADLPVVTPWLRPDGYSAFHLYVIRIDRTRTNVSRRSVFDRMRAAGSGVNVHYIPIHTQPCYRQLGFEEGDYPAAERYYAEALSLPIFPGLKDEEQDSVVRVLQECLT